MQWTGFVLCALTLSFAIGTNANEVQTEEFPLIVLDNSYGIGGTAGNYTIEIKGDGFDRTVTVELRDSSGNLVCEATSYYRPNTQRLYATFNLSSLIPDIYDVVIHKLTTDEIIIVPTGLTVVQGGGGTNKPRLEYVPTHIVRDPNQFYFFEVVWENTGINDVLSPVLEVKCSELFNEDPNALLNGWGQYHYVFYGIPDGGGPLGILRPGQKGRKTFLINPQPLAPGRIRDIVYKVDRLYKDPNKPFDWSSILEDIQLLDINDEQFGHILAQLSSQVGDTCGDFLQMLSRNASLLGKSEKNPPSWEECVSVEIALAQALLGTSIMGTLKNSDMELCLSNASVTALNLETGQIYVARTMTDGSFVLSVEPGSYSFSCVKAAIPDQVKITVNQDQCTAVEIQISHGGELQGNVSLENGTPASDVEIRIIKKGDNPTQYSVWTDTDGYYQFLHLPAGEYFITSSVSNMGWCPEQAVSVVDGSIITIDLYMSNTSPLNINIMRWVDSKAVEDADVTLISEDNGIRIIKNTDSNGVAEFHVVPGLYKYQAFADGLIPVFGDVFLNPEMKHIDISMIEYGALLVSIPDDMNSLIDGIVAIEPTNGRLYLGALSNYAYQFNSVVPGIYDILWLGKNGPIGSTQVEIQAGCTTTISIRENTPLKMANYIHTTSSSLSIPDDLDIDLGEILVVEAYNLVSNFDSIVAAGKAAVMSEVEIIGDFPTKPYKYPELDLDFPNDLVKDYVKLCDNREKCGENLARLWHQRTDNILLMNTVLEQLEYLNRISEVTNTSNWLSILIKRSRLAPLGRVIGNITDLADVVQKIRCIGYLKIVQELIIELSQNREQILQITQPYNRDLEFYESYAKIETKYIDDRAAAAVQAWFTLASYELVANQPGEIVALTSIYTLNGINWTLYIRDGESYEYNLWDIMNRIVTVPGLAVQHEIFVNDSGKCARVQHKYRLGVDGVMKYIYSCHGGYEHIPVRLTGPIGVFQMSIELCGGGSSGNDPNNSGSLNQDPDIIIGPGEGSGNNEDQDDSGNSSDDSNGSDEDDDDTENDCPEGMFPHPFPDNDGEQNCINCNEAQPLFYAVCTNFKLAAEEINRLAEAGQFEAAMALDIEATAIANRDFTILSQLWLENNCEETTGLNYETLILQCGEIWESE